MMVEGMNKTMAWNPASVRPIARRIAEDAANRAGVSLEDWLDEAIVERAVGAKLHERPREAGQHAAGRRRYAVSRRDFGRILGTEESQVRDAQDFIESAIARIAEQIALGEERAARALETIAHLLERKDQSPALAAQSLPIAGADAETGSARLPAAHRNLDERMAEIVLRLGASQPSAEELKSSPAAAGERPRLDISDAVSQIALRRKALASSAFVSLEPAQQPGETPPQELGDNGNEPAERPGRPAESVNDAPKRPSALESPQDALAPARKDDSQGEQIERISAADLTAVREDIAAMMRAIGDLAPRNAVVALEGAVRGLTDRVALLRQDGHSESLLAPLESTAAELRKTLKSHDPAAVAAGLETELRGLRGKIDELAKAAINPETFERLRLQTEELRDLLVSAAARTPPVERLERQIGELADRVERLGESLSPHVESAQMAASLAEVRQEIERSAPLPALASIERRLEQIATRLEQEIPRPVQDGADQRRFEDLARRIDAVRQSLDARPQPQIDTSGLEASLTELNVRLASPYAEPFAKLMREINDKLDASDLKGGDANATESLFGAIIQKLDRLAEPRPGSVVDMNSIEQALKTLHAKIDDREGRTVDRQLVAQVAEEVSRRLNGSVTQADDRRLADELEAIHARLEALSGQIGAADSLGSAVRDLLNRLPAGRETLVSPEDHAGLSKDLEELKNEQVNSDIRVQAGLAEIQAVLRTLSAQVSSVESELAEGLHDESSARSTGRRKSQASLSVEGLGQRRSLESAPDTFDSAIRASDDDNSSEQQSGDGEVLLEPGAGSPRQTGESRDLAQAIGSKTSPSVSAHIAAARRAAQTAFWEGVPAKDGGARPPAARGVERAKSLYANHRRSVLLGFALAIVVTVAARLVSAPPIVRKSDADRPNAATTGLSLAKPAGSTAAAGPAERPLDTTPTASIAPVSEPAKTSIASGASPADPLAMVPAGVSPFLRDAVLAGSPGAQYELAQRLFEGRGLPQDQQAAAVWFERAASSGLAPAQYRIGALYQKGVGVGRDAALAKHWYVRAAEAGNARAAHNLAVMYVEPAGDKPDYAEAAKWFRKAAELGVRDSQFNLAVLYTGGLGVNQDLRQAWIWFSLAAAQGDEDASRKRDEVAAKLDPAALAASTAELATVKVAKPDPVANEVVAPRGGWDAKPGAS